MSMPTPPPGPALPPTTPLDGGRTSILEVAPTELLGARQPGGPAQGATTPRRPGPKATFLAVVAGIVTLSVVMTLGWSTSVAQRASKGAQTLTHLIKPSSAWADGATQQWSTTVAKDAQVLAADGKVLVVERSSSSDSKAIITAYDASSSRMSKIWSRKVDLSQGTVDTDNGTEFLVWGDFLVHGRTLVNLDNGKTSKAPWPDGQAPHVADDTIITCDILKMCSAWRTTSSKAVWTAELGMVAGEIRTGLDVEVRGQERYVILGMRTIINLDTGKTLDLRLSGNQEHGYVIAVTDGWIMRVPSQKSTEMYSYSLDGQVTGSYTPTLEQSSTQVPILPYTGPVTQAVKKSIWAEGSVTPVATVHLNDEACLTSITLEDGHTITPPNVGDSNCVTGGILSADSSVVMTYDKSTVTVTGAAVYNLRTGQQITFEGMDASAGHRLYLVSPDLIVSHDPKSGTIRGYTPS